MDPLLSSQNTLLVDFVQRLPQKLTSSVSPLEIDFSKAKMSKGERRYYEKQVEMLRMQHNVDKGELTYADDEDQQSAEIEEKQAIVISNIANCFILLFKVLATVQTGSLAIATSTLDSFLDTLAGGILLLTFISLKKVNHHKYPVGKVRMQPIGLVVFSSIMATLGVIVIIQAGAEIRKGIEEIEGSTKMSSSQWLWLSTVMTSSTVVKIYLWVRCKHSGSGIVRAYAEDHFFDVATNVVGFIAAMLGELKWWTDPVGAVLLSMYSIWCWSGIVLKNAVSLTGVNAPAEIFHKLLYVTLKHSPAIKSVDRLNSYKTGDLCFVEVDIELPENMSLKESHPIANSLQSKLEQVSEIERAFVHRVHKSYNQPEHTIVTRIPITE